MFRLTRTASAVAIALAFSSFAAEAAQRTFVASFGSDANTAANCSFASPCRGFAAALTVTNAGGEVVALDAAGYGVVTITQSVTITANPGFYAGITASAGAAITIGTAGVDVVIRGLNINGLGANNGIAMTAGASLTVENCVISNFANNGINVFSAGTVVRVADSVVRDSATLDGIRIGGGAVGTINNVKMSGNGRAGLVVEDGAGATSHVSVMNSEATNNALVGMAALSQNAGTARLSVTQSTLSNNAGIGIWSVGTDSQVAVGGSLIANNTIGAQNDSTILETFGTNILRYNGTPTVGTITTSAGF